MAGNTVGIAIVNPVTSVRTHPRLHAKAPSESSQERKSKASQVYICISQCKTRSDCCCLIIRVKTINKDLWGETQVDLQMALIEIHFRRTTSACQDNTRGQL